jgi:hypothetical protein
MFTMRFDMRTPDNTATPALYGAALEMCAWAETRGGVIAVLSEHHATADGHLPSPLILASAIAARTKVLNTSGPSSHRRRRSSTSSPRRPCTASFIGTTSNGSTTRSVGPLEK